MRRTTLALDDALFRALKARAAREGIPLGQLVNDLLHQAQSLSPARRKKPRWITFKGDGLLPGVDLDDRRALYDRMDETPRGRPPR